MFLQGLVRPYISLTIEVDIRIHHMTYHRKGCISKKIQAGADITGQLQVWPMLYTLYIGINLTIVKMLHTDNKQQIRK